MADNKKLAFLMVDFETPDFIKELHNKIPEDELFTDPDDEVFNYGLEKETHITLAACLDNEVDLDEIKVPRLPSTVPSITPTSSRIRANPPNCYARFYLS